MKTETPRPTLEQLRRGTPWCWVVCEHCMHRKHVLPQVQGDELRAIKRYLASRDDKSPWLFVSERGTQMTRQAVNYLIGTMAHDAGLPKVHPHTLRHSCGYYLADRGTDLRTMQDYLGHRDPRHTVRYTRVHAPVAR